MFVSESPKKDVRYKRTMLLQLNEHIGQPVVKAIVLQWLQVMRAASKLLGIYTAIYLLVCLEPRK